MRYQSFFKKGPLQFGNIWRFLSIRFLWKHCFFFQKKSQNCKHSTNAKQQTNFFNLEKKVDKFVLPEKIIQRLINLQKLTINLIKHCQPHTFYLYILRSVFWKKKVLRTNGMNSWGLARQQSQKYDIQLKIYSIKSVNRMKSHDR